eukprot:5244027-Amphidinium_carterae.2
MSTWPQDVIAIGLCKAKPRSSKHPQLTNSFYGSTNPRCTSVVKAETSLRSASVNKTKDQTAATKPTQRNTGDTVTSHRICVAL